VYAKLLSQDSVRIKPRCQAMNCSIMWLFYIITCHRLFLFSKSNEQYLRYSWISREEARGIFIGGGHAHAQWTRQTDLMQIRVDNKKFELMLTRRAKAYSSSGSVVTHRSTNRAQHRVTLFQTKRATNYATPPTPEPWRRLVNDIDAQPNIMKKIHKTPYFGVRGHPRSLNSAPIDSQCTISY